MDEIGLFYIIKPLTLQIATKAPGAMQKQNMPT